MIKIVLFASLYLSSLEIKGGFLLPQFTKKSFIKAFERARVEPDTLIDSLFKLYEDIGFFNVKFDVEIDTIDSDTACMKIKVITPHLPVIDEVALLGVRLPFFILNTYFPFKKKVFRRKRVLESFRILENLGIIKDAQYYFVPSSLENHYTLKINAPPAFESFYLNLKKGIGEGLSGIVSLSHPSLLGTGLGLSTSLGVDNGKISHYNVKGTFLLPFIRGVMLKVEGLEIDDSIKTVEKMGEISMWGVRSGVSVGLGEFNTSFFTSFKLFAYEKAWRMALGLEKKGGWIMFQHTGFRDKFGVSMEQGFIIPNTYHYILLSKPLRMFERYVPEETLFHYFLLRTLIPYKENVGLFMDFGDIGGEYLLDIGAGYIKKTYGIYVGYSLDRGFGNINIGLAIGVKNSIFERSIYIL